MTVDVVIIGGGIAGLSAAWYAQQNGLRYLLLEKSTRWGGKVHSEQIDIGADAPLTVEYGPDGFITRKPWALDCMRELGADDQLIAVNKTRERIYVLNGGNLAPLPPGLRLLVPTDIPAFLRSTLISPIGKARMLLDVVIPARAGDDDESMAQFVTRRLGREALDKLAEPLLAGVFNAQVEKQSVLATFAMYRRIEQKHGSLIRGMRRIQRETPPSDAPGLLSFRHGMGAMVDAFTARLTGDLRLNCGVNAMNKADTYTVTLDDGTQANAHAVIVAIQAPDAARLLQNIAPDAAHNLRAIRYAGIGSITLAYPREAVPHALDAYGIVIPSSERRLIDGITWLSSKWVDRAPADVALLRVFFGGAHTRHMLDRDDDDVRYLVRRELRDVLKIKADPIAHRITRWPNGYPQFDVGHLKRIQAIEAALPDGGVHVAGNAYDGVGLPDTIHRSKRLIELIVNSA
jgi:protoporphyrinogen/coproporphyrinogen III oxidase